MMELAMSNAEASPNDKRAKWKRTLPLSPFGFADSFVIWSFVI